MVQLDQLRPGTIANWMGYASAMGYHADTRLAQQPGFCRMRRDIGVVANIPCPPHFIYDVVG